MTDKQTKLLQQVCGTFLYYERAVDCIMIHALNDLATKATGVTQQITKVLTIFLNYCTTNLEAEVIYQANYMILHNQSDAAYLVASKVRSLVGGYTFLANKDNIN